MRNVERFFDYARERHEIHLRRSSGAPPPWTRDKILRQYRFCCVFREHDRTTVWFRERVRDRLRSRPEVLLAAVVFRMFNRTETGEAVFCDDDLLGDASAFELFALTGKITVLRDAILRRVGERGPYVTGSYIISTPPGYKKLDGVLEILRRFHGTGWMEAARNWGGRCSLETAWDWLRQCDYLGVFHSYEIVTDLRHTRLLDRAPDIETWANPGPGARRGLSRVWTRGLLFRPDRERQIEMMRELLTSSRDARLWPRDWPAWEMREVEHTLCEFDKYERVRRGEGRPRGTFMGGEA